MSKRKPAINVNETLVTDNSNALLFDTRPVEVSGFRLRGRDIEVVGTPGIKEFQNALALACEFHESSPYWIGGLVAYAEDRAEWREKLSQAMAVTKLAEQTLHNLGYLYRHSTPLTRSLAPSPGHLNIVAKYPEVEQAEILEVARTENMTVAELKVAVRSRKRRLVIEGRAVLEGQFRVLYVDFPWRYGDRPPSGSGSGENYPTMTYADGETWAETILPHVTKEAAMGFWVPAPLLYDTGDGDNVPGPLRIIRALDFEPKAQFIWDKGKHVYGHYVSVQHEILVLCTRGSCTPDRLTPMLDSVVSCPPPSEDHSAKPPIFRGFLERLWDGPYLELFASANVEGWTCWGNDARLSVPSASGS